MPGPAHNYNLTIREHHLDTFGHVNNATYLQLLEEARWEWITEGGYGLQKVVETQQGPTILECTLRFKRELRNRDQLRIESAVESYAGKLGTVLQRIWRGEELCCEARFVMGLFDVAGRRLIAPTPEWLSSVGLSLEDLSAS